MLKIYTDGSCDVQKRIGAFAFISICEETNTEIHWSEAEINTTNNIMELKAVIEAIKTFPEVNCFSIRTDSMYVINCSQGNYKRTKNLELWSVYDKISTGKQIEFIHVRGHSGDVYNELVNSLAIETRKNFQKKIIK